MKQPLPDRPLLYFFQHVGLPEATFQNHPELIRELYGPPSSSPLDYIRSQVQIRLVLNGLIVLPDEDDVAEFAAEKEFWKGLAVHPHRRNGYTVHVITMPKPQFIREAHYVAIVHKDDEPKDYMRASPSTRYFALEKSQIHLPFLCECRRDGSRKNYGEGPAPEITAFTEAVFERIAADGQHGCNRVLLDERGCMLMMFAPRSSTGYHSVSVEFEDGTRVSDARVYRMCELELPSQFLGKKIKTLAINSRQP
jgi:hypothetical protein